MDEFRHDSLGEAVTDWLARQIIQGELAPGTWLTETEIADRLKVSRSPVREAFHNLAKEGLIKVWPRKGTEVARLDWKDGADLYDCRTLLEPECAGLAVAAVQPADVQRLGDLLRQMEAAARAGDGERYLERNIHYHEALCALCPNRVLASLIVITWRKALRYRYVVLRAPGRVAASVELHRHLHAAVEALNPDQAAAVVRRIITESKAVLAAQFSQVAESRTT